MRLRTCGGLRCGRGQIWRRRVPDRRAPPATRYGEGPRGRRHPRRLLAERLRHEPRHPLAADLAKNGIAGYAIEYRRVGNGGGWPATFEDVAAAIDALADQPRIDLTKVVAIGHSAGGQLALWAAARPGLPTTSPGASPRVRLRGAVSQAGVLDLAAAYRQQVGGSAVQDLLGGTPDSHPDRYKLASPTERLPLKVPVALVHGNRDSAVPLVQSQTYLAAARTAGDTVTLTELPHIGHFELIDPNHPAWTTCRTEATRLLG